METRVASISTWKMVLTLSGILVALTFARVVNFLLFHSLAELFSVVVAFGVFVVAWNARRFDIPGYLLWLGLAYPFVAGLEVAHTLTYHGMGVFPGHGVNLPTQLWLAARFMETGAWLVAPFFTRRSLRTTPAAVCLAVVFSALLATVHWGVFPVAYSDTQGRLTAFKIWSEYAVCCGLLVAGYLLWKRRMSFDGAVLRLVLASLGVAVASELMFTLYSDPYGVANLLGHYLKIVSCYLIYVAVIETGLTRPFGLMFRELKRSQEELRALNEKLEREVGVRTEQLRRRAKQLQALASELTRAEQRERRRLAQLLHDHLQQLLVAAKMQVAILRCHLDGHSAEEAADRLSDLLRQSIEASRSLTVELCPPALYDAGLSAALEWLATRVREQHGLRVEVAAAPQANPLNESVRVLLFEAVRELLFNIVKHSGQDRAGVEVDLQDGWVTLAVADQGRGFDVASVLETDHGGFGLFSIKERLEALGGSMRIESKPGLGTRVLLAVPVGASPDRERRG
jgi:signal transduction histidine kinase